MKNSKIIKLHVGEEKELPEIGISVKFLFKKDKEEKEIEYSWFDRTQEENKHFNVFDFEVFVINGTYSFMEKKDHLGDWIKIVVIKLESDKKIDYKKLLQHYLKIDYRIRTLVS